MKNHMVKIEKGLGFGRGQYLEWFSQINSQRYGNVPRLVVNGGNEGWSKYNKY